MIIGSENFKPLVSLCAQKWASEILRDWQISIIKGELQLRKKQSRSSLSIWLNAWSGKKVTDESNEYSHSVQGSETSSAKISWFFLSGVKSETISFLSI